MTEPAATVQLDVGWLESTCKSKIRRVVSYIPEVVFNLPTV